MTVIEGNIQDIGMAPLSGVLVATSVDFRASGDVVIAPESRSFPVEAGLVSADLVPGPTRLTVQVGSHARGEFDVVVPDEGPVSLALLVEEAFPWDPPQVREFVRLRDEAVDAAGRAEQAAEDVDSAIAGAADQVVAAVEADRVAAEQAASDAAGSASAAAGSESAAATSAAVAGTQATLAGERAGDAGVARDAASGSASAAAGSASAAASSASDSAGSATDADSARAAAVVARTGAESARSGAEDARDAADGHATRAETAANEFDLTATATTGAAGSNAAVTVTGDGPAYALGFTIPRGDKGPPGDPGEVSQAMLDAAVATLVDGAPEALDTLGKLVTALQNHELGGSTDASLLTGSLTDQVDVGAAMTVADLNFPGGPGVTNNTVAGWVSTLYYMGHIAMEGLGSKSDVGHTHPVADLATTGTASSSTYLRGDGTWATPANTTYSVPTQAEAEAGTATTARAFSAQRVAQGAIAASGKKDWQGTQAQYDALPTKDADRTYWIV